MTVASKVPENVYSGNFSNKQFDFDFLIENESELLVKHIDKNGNVTILQNGVDYSINEINNPDGSYIIFPLNTSSFYTLRSNEKIYITLNLPIQQTEDFKNSLRFKYDAVEWTFDYIIRILQIFAAKLARCVFISENSENSAEVILNELETTKNAMITATDAANSVSEKIDTFNSEYDEKIKVIIDSDVSNKLNLNLDNISEEGEKHFIGRYALTNCITAKPPRLKISLLNGVLTLEKGSIVTIPYGVYDLSEDYPAGSVFLNNNLLVYDTQFLNGKFFIWAEIQQDLTISRNANHQEMLFYNAITGTLTARELTGCFSGASISNPVQYMVWYSTTNNQIKKTSDTGSSWSDILAFPLAIVNENSSQITNVVSIFSGVGFIGSTIWVDKDIKGLIPNGRTLEGNLNNIEVTNRNLETINYTGSGDIYALVDSTGRITLNGVRTYDNVTNYIYDGNNISSGFEVAHFRCVNGVISNFKVITQVETESAQNVDGDWVYEGKTIASSLAAGGSTLTYSLSDYLPDDGNDYELLLSSNISTGSSSGNQVSAVVSTDKIGQLYLCRAVTRTSSTAVAGGSGIILVGTLRNISVIRSSDWNGSINVSVLAYRKVR